MFPILRACFDSNYDISSSLLSLNMKIMLYYIYVQIYVFSLGLLCIGESPSKYPFLKNNGSEAPKGPRIHYFSGMDTYSDFLRLKIHHTLAPFRYNKRF